MITGQLQKNIKVSFVVAIYNVGKYLEKCIESLIKQEMKEVEIILVNDGSKDDCLEICNTYAKRDSRITVIDQKNQGAGAARNSGLHAARGEWIFFVDGDDYVDPRVLINLAEYMDSELDVICFTNVVNQNGRIRNVKHSEKQICFDREDFIELQLSTLNRLGKYKYEMDVVEPACVWNKLYRREFLQNNGIVFVTDLSRLEDIYFSLQVYDKAQKGIYVPVEGYYYRLNQASVTHRYQANVIREFETINARFQQFAQSKSDPRFMRAFDERVVTHIRTCTVLYLCNARNPKGYRERKKMFMRLRMSEPYRGAVERVSIFDYNRYKERVLALAVKYKCFFMCEILCRLNDIRQRVIR